MRVRVGSAGDLPGIVAGARIDTRQIARSMHDRARNLSNGSPRVPIATVHVPGRFTVDERMSNEAMWEVLTAAADASRLDLTQLSSLTASGGWCTPSEYLFDLFEMDAATGLFDLPTVTVTRGGVQVPDYVGIDAADGALWSWSEDQDAENVHAVANKALTGNVATLDTATDHHFVVGQTVAVAIGDPVFDGVHVVATTPDANTFTYAVTHANVASAAVTAGTVTGQKGCFSIPCPSWTEYRLAAEGLCLSHGNLTDRAFPELTRRYVALVMAAHQRRISARHLAAVASSVHSTAVTVTDITATDSFGNLMSAIELQVEDYRSQFKISANTVMETVLPSWTLANLRATLAMRAGVDLLAVTDQQIAAHFAARKVRPQFVEDFNPLWTGGADTPAVVWPATTEFVMYPAGSMFAGNGGTIDLGVVRDSKLNATNDFTAAWTEQFVLTGRKGPKGRKVTVALRTTGVTG